MVSVELVKSRGVKTDKICPDCKQQLVLITTFGKETCKNCYIQKPHKKGHSGMIPMKKSRFEEKLREKRPDESLHLVNVTKGNKFFASLYLSHYPQSRGIVGRSINYIVYYGGYIAGIVGANSPPIQLKPIDTFFEITRENRQAKLKGLLNNNIYRLTNNEHNLGTRVLSLFHDHIRTDYYLKYGDVLTGLLTFVEPPRTGTVYKADNWTYLGMTKGLHVTRRGKMWHTKVFEQGTKKHIYGYKYKKRFVT